jgi:hypothetical protein
MQDGKKAAILRILGRCEGCPGPEGRVDRRLLWCLKCMVNERREPKLASVYVSEMQTWGGVEGKVVAGKE